MTTRIDNQENQEDSMSTATPTRAPHSDVPTGHKDEGRVGAGLFDPKQLIKSLDRKSTRLNSSHYGLSRMPSSA